MDLPGSLHKGTSVLRTALLAPVTHRLAVLIPLKAIACDVHRKSLDCAANTCDPWGEPPRFTDTARGRLLTATKAYSAFTSAAQSIARSTVVEKRESVVGYDGMEGREL